MKIAVFAALLVPIPLFDLPVLEVSVLSPNKHGDNLYLLKSACFMVLVKTDPTKLRRVHPGLMFQVRLALLDRSNDNTHRHLRGALRTFPC